MERNTYSVTLFIGSVSSHRCLDVPEVLYHGYIETQDWRQSPLYLQLFLLCMVLVQTPRRIPPSTIPKESSKHYVSTFNDRVSYKIDKFKKQFFNLIKLKVLQTHIWNKRYLVFLSFIHVLLLKMLRVKQNNLAGLGDLAENTVRFHFHINM